MEAGVRLEPMERAASLVVEAPKPDIGPARVPHLLMVEHIVKDRPQSLQHVIRVLAVSHELSQKYPRNWSLNFFIGGSLTFDNNLFAALVHTEKGTQCSDSGLQDLSTNQECSDAFNYAKSFNGNAQYVGSGYWSRNHKGCFIYDSGLMGFNTHYSGNNRADQRSICRKGNYYASMHHHD